jgi:DNA-binding SARP family transcriptional activator
MADGGRLGFNVLGSLQMTVDGCAGQAWYSQAAGRVGNVDHQPQPPVGVDTLITDAWEDRPPRNPTASVHTYIAELRKLVKDAERSTLWRCWQPHRPVRAGVQPPRNVAYRRSSSKTP